jgi:excisionase family DNA binding protein
MESILFTGVTVDNLLFRIEQIVDAKISGQLQKTSEKQSDLISRKEVSKLLKVSLPTLHEYTKMGLLQSYRIGNRVLYKREEVEKSLNQVMFQKNKKGGLHD